MEGIAGIVAHFLVAEHKGGMVYAHRHARTTLLKRADHLYQPRIEMRGFLEVAVG